MSHNGQGMRIHGREFTLHFPQNVAHPFYFDRKRRCFVDSGRNSIGGGHIIMQRPVTRPRDARAFTPPGQLSVLDAAGLT